MANPGLGQSEGVAFLVSAGIVFEIIAAACSSPQTTELNANTRAQTLMKWVTIGVVMAAVFVAIAAFLDRKRGNNAAAIMGGGALAGGLMFACYSHAKKAGLRSRLPGTEQ